MQETFKIWPITNYDEYLNQWPAIPGKFDKLTDYQKSLGYKDPKDFFDKQVFAAQTLANDRVGGIVEKVFKTEDLTPRVQEQLKKFTYQTIDFLRMNDSVINFDIRTNQISFNNNRQFTSGTNIERIEQLCGPMAWRSWTLANIDRLYASWADCNTIPYLLDEDKFYPKKDIDFKLGEIDDQIQVQQKLVDEKLKEFNEYMAKHLSDFSTALPKNKEFIELVVGEAAKNPKLKGEKGDQGPPGSVNDVPEPTKPNNAASKRYTDAKDAEVLLKSADHSDAKFKLNTANPQGLDYAKTGHLNMKGVKIIEVANPTENNHVATKGFVENHLKDNPIVEGIRIRTGLPNSKDILKIDDKTGQLTLNNSSDGQIDQMLQTDPQNSGNINLTSKGGSSLVDIDREKAVVKYKGNEIATQKEALWLVKDDYLTTKEDIPNKLKLSILIFNVKNSPRAATIINGETASIVFPFTDGVVSGLGTPTGKQDATRKEYVDRKLQYLLEKLMPDKKDQIQQLMIEFDNSLLPRNEFK